MRTFLALELPENIRKQLQTVSSRLQAHNLRKIKWVDPHNYHITLTFIGETDNGKEVSDAIADSFGRLVSPEFSEPELTLVPGKAPRILWVEYKCSSQEITVMNKRFRQKLAELGYSLDNKPLRFHVTLARIKGGVSPQFTQDVLNMRIPPIKFISESLTFYESRLKPEGAEYFPLSELRLN